MHAQGITGEAETIVFPAALASLTMPPPRRAINASLAASNAVASYYVTSTSNLIAGHAE
jgi:hypothetical protein